MADLPPPPPPPPGTPVGPDDRTTLARGDDPPWPDPDGRHDAGDPDEAFRPGLSLLAAFGLVSWSFLAQVLVVGVAVAAGLDVAGVSDLANIALVGLMQVVTIVGILAGVRLAGTSLWRLFGPVRPAWRHVAQGVGLGLTGLLLVQVTAALVLSALPDAQTPEQSILDAQGGVLVVLGQVLVAVVLAPFVEEFIYRGALFQAARARFGLVGGMVVSSLVFAGVHQEVWGSAPAMFGLVVLGLWFAAIFHRTGSLLVPIVAHATFNGVTLALALLVPPIA